MDDYEELDIIRFSPIKLPYRYNALEPYIDEETMQIHYNKHYLGYLKKFKQSTKTLKTKKQKIISKWFNGFSEISESQIHVNDKIFKLLNNESNVYDIIEDQELLMDELKIKINKLKVFKNYNIYLELNDQLSLISSKMENAFKSA